MPLVIGFAELTVGLVLAIAGISGRSLADVLKGNVSLKPSVTAGDGLDASAAAGASTPTAQNLKGAPPAVQRMFSEASALTGRPYQWGGGHSISDWLNAAAYDCSGFVSAVLGYGGVLSGPQTTQTLASQPGIESGPGKWVTIYDRTDAGSGQDHVIIDIGGNWFESGGDSQFNPGGGVSSIEQPSASYLASFNRRLHPAGY